MANLFENQTENGNSQEVNVSSAHQNLKIEGDFDGATIRIETTYFDLSWVQESDNSGSVIQITEPTNIAFDALVSGTKIRLVLSNAGAGTDITAGIF